tara:strand:- start:245 stop:664 length:420 start_codon:yes stop_codon:yes gene_type:complete
MRTIGLDVGERRVGIAICDTAGILATPYSAIERKSLDRDILAISEIAAKEEVMRIVVGMPFSLDGSEGYQAKKTLIFYEAIKEAIAPIRVELWDERFSTDEAARRLAEAGVAPSRNKARLDASAAAVILQSYLDTNRMS